MNTQDISFKNSLLNYIRGMNDAEAAVDKTYEKTLRDLILRPILAELDMTRLRRNQPPPAATSSAWPAQEIGELSPLPFDIVAPPPDASLANPEASAALIAGAPPSIRTPRGAVLDETF